MNQLLNATLWLNIMKGTMYVNGDQRRKSPQAGLESNHPT